jgi:two-component system, response regulator YesN
VIEYGVNQLVPRLRSVFVSWLLSYILILIVPLALTTVVYFVSIDVIEDQLTKAHVASLGQVQHFLDSRFEDMDSLSVQIAQSDRVRSLAFLHSEMLPIHRYNLLEVLSDLANLSAANGFVDDIFLYYPRLDMVLSGAGRYRVQEFYETFFSGRGYRFDEWRSLLERRHSRDFVMLRRTLVGGQGVESFSLMHSIPLGNPFRQDATLVVSLTEETVLQAFDSIGWADAGSGYIVEPQGRFLASINGNGDLEPALREVVLSSPASVSTIEVERRKYVTSSLGSNVGPWHYVAVLPTEVFLQQARYVRNLLVLAILACMAIGLAVAYVFSKRNYNPVDRLVQLVAARSGDAPAPVGNEFGYLQESILDVLDENEQMTDQLERQKEALRASFLSRLVRGRTPLNVPVEAAIEMYHLNLDRGLNCAFAIYIESVHRPNGDDGFNDVERGLQNVRAAVIRVATELTQPDAKLYAFETDEMLICVLDFTHKNRELANQAAISLAHGIRDSAHDLVGIECRIAVGRAYEGLDHLSDSYHEALQALEFGLLVGSDPVARYDDLPLRATPGHLRGYSLEEEQRLVNCIRAGEYAAAREVVDEIIEENFRSGAASLAMVKVRMSGLVNVILNVLGEISIAFDDEFMESLNAAQRLLQAQSISELHEVVTGILLEVEQDHVAQQGDSGHGIVDKAMDLVRDEYADANLNVSRIADRLGVNVTYLSRQFKQKKGVGLLDYTQRVRVQEAMRLLRDPEASIKETAEAVGFYNSISFIRVFKKHEGITPGVYKKFAANKKDI